MSQNTADYGSFCPFIRRLIAAQRPSYSLAEPLSTNIHDEGRLRLSLASIDRLIRFASTIYCVLTVLKGFVATAMTSAIDRSPKRVTFEIGKLVQVEEPTVHVYMYLHVCVQ